ncbi:MAG: hypothetical protein ABIP75_01395 [Pyrinomonadaceae bacterium]
MKRILLSFCLGIPLSLLYVLFVILSMGIARQLNFSRDANAWWFQALDFPLEWGGRLLVFFFPPDHEKVFALLHGRAILADIVGCILFFSVLGYLFLWWRSRRVRLA